MRAPPTFQTGGVLMSNFLSRVCLAIILLLSYLFATSVSSLPYAISKALLLLPQMGVNARLLQRMKGNTLQTVDVSAIIDGRKANTKKTPRNPYMASADIDKSLGSTLSLWSPNNDQFGHDWMTPFLLVKIAAWTTVLAVGHDEFQRRYAGNLANFSDHLQ